MLMVIAFPCSVLCQNIVPNPSFEDYNVCPANISGVAFSPTYSSFPTAKDWINPLQYTSPDYCNVCAVPSSGVHIPEVTFGYQKPRTGNAYAGLILWEESTTPGNLYGFGEYLETKLTTPMVAGKDYCVSFYVSPTITFNLQFNYIAMDEVGIHLSNSQVSQATGSFLPLSYDVRNPSGKYLSDTSSWLKVTGTYKATGGEEWLTLGRFSNGMPASKLSYPATANPTLAYRAYMYIDDIDVHMIKSGDTVTARKDSIYCNSAAMPMHLFTASKDGDFIWSNGAISPDLTVTTDGIYWCRNITDCRVYVDTFIVKQDPNSKLNLGKELVDCTNSPITIQANNKFDSYKWSTGDTGQSIVATTPGVYWLRTTSKCGVQTDTVRVYIQPPTAVPIVRDTFVCQLSPSPVLKDITGTNIQWYTHQLSNIGSPIQPYIYTGAVTDYQYYITQTVGKCESKKVPVKIDVRYQPKHELDDEIAMCRYAPFLIGTNYPGVRYYWSNANRNCCIVPQNEGHFTVTRTNECGSYTDSTIIKFNVCEECIKVPNAFTPDGDGINDKWVVFQTCPISNYFLHIFDRWGNKVFETRDITQFWTGTTEGLYLEAGVYVYYIEYTPDATQINKYLRGTVSVLR